MLISDTHGKLGIINELAAHIRADAVIHAGDFGFFDDGNIERLSDRKIRLHVAHSDLPRTEKTRILALSSFAGGRGKEPSWMPRENNRCHEVRNVGAGARTQPGC